MSHRLLLTVFLTSIFLTSCVSPKVHRAEVSMREQCEARERVLVQEQLERRKESANLTKQIGDLNRLIGNQEAELKDLQTELSSRTQQLGESSSKLLTEKLDLQKELTSKNALIGKQEATLQAVSSAQKSRQKILEELKNALLKGFPGSTGAKVEVSDPAVLLTLPDNGLFETNGISISPAGKTLLTPLASLLANRPELRTEILAYTDNTLPKGTKNLNDTWDWSLTRTTNVVRLLIRDFNINANQLTPVAKGEFYPVTSNETAEGRQRNRRTVVVIYPNLPKVPPAE
jgi:chemotaxis protein MotB